MLALNALDDLFMTVPIWHHHVARSAAPRHQLRETADAYELDLALPGLRPDDLKVTLEDGVLAVEGQTKHTSASHRLRAPRDIDADAVEAASANGILTITLPKRSPPKHELTVAEGAPTTSTSEDDYRLELPLPGMRPSDLTLIVEDSVLSIEGETKTDRRNFAVSRRHRLPADVDIGATVAGAENGILTVVLPKSKGSNFVPQAIQIKEGSSQPKHVGAVAEAALKDAPAAAAGA